jgi:hypothetical protein
VRVRKVIDVSMAAGVAAREQVSLWSRSESSAGSRVRCGVLSGDTPLPSVDFSGTLCQCRWHPCSRGPRPHARFGCTSTAICVRPTPDPCPALLLSRLQAASSQPVAVIFVASE